MTIDLKPLVDKAFYHEQSVKNATLSIEKAAEDFAKRTNTDGTSYEVVASPHPDQEWAERRLLHPLVYFCESEGRPIPRCAGVFLSLFVGNDLHCIAASEVFEWASQALGLSIGELRARYGTHEVETSLR